jgi:hypothetical protein
MPNLPQEAIHVCQRTLAPSNALQAVSGAANGILRVDQNAHLQLSLNSEPPRTAIKAGSSERFRNDIPLFKRGYYLFLDKIATTLR